MPPLRNRGDRKKPSDRGLVWSASTGLGLGSERADGDALARRGLEARDVRVFEEPPEGSRQRVIERLCVSGHHEGRGLRPCGRADGELVDDFASA
jgi:hypothetical protein